MIFSAFLQFFLVMTGQVPAQVPSIAEAAGQTVAAAGLETIAAAETSLGKSFTFRLPLPSENKAFGPSRKPSNSLGIVTSASSIYVVDDRTWSVLYDKGSTEVRSIASITKLMTGLVLLDQGFDAKKTITVTKADYRTGGKYNVFAGEQFPMQDVWLIGYIASDNVAMAALARSTGLSEEEFVLLMNRKALDLGMKNTHFVEPTGIDSGNVSTAQDVALMLAEAMKHVEISDAVRRPSYAFEALNKKGRRTVKSTNVLLNSFVNKDPYRIVGGKTGFTNEAGYCLSLLVDGPNPADNVVVVMLGAASTEDRFQDMKGIVDWVYENYRW